MALTLGQGLAPDVQELRALAESAGAEVSAVISGRRDRPDPALFAGSGKCDEIFLACQEHAAELVIFDHTLSPGQQRNLTKLLKRRVIDRVALILDIFALRARSHEGKLQVELAQLDYLSARLVRGWTHLERQKGGIGLRGPGETQLETDRRLIGQRVKQLRSRLALVDKQRRNRRRQRDRQGAFRCLWWAIPKRVSQPYLMPLLMQVFMLQISYLPRSIRRAGGCFSRRESLWSYPIRLALFGSFLTA